MKLTEAEAASAFARAARHFEAGEFEPAAELCRALQASLPKHPGVLGLYGLVQLKRGRREEGLEKLRRAAKLAPDDAILQANLRTALRDSGRGSAAKEAADRGWALLPRGRDAEALAEFERWAALAPEDPAAHDSLGQALQKLRRWEEAVDAHSRALALAPRAGGALVNLGLALGHAGRVVEAEDALRRAMEIPDFAADAGTNLAMLILRHRGDEAAALVRLEAVLAHAPANRAARTATASILLARGEFATGFELFEARFAPDALGRGMRAQPFPQPRWRGEDLGGRTLLLWGEQGVGDDIFFAHALPALAPRAKRILLWVDRRLVPLFARSFPANVETFGREGAPSPALLGPEVDFQAPLGDAVRHAYESPAAIAPQLGFLRADPDRVASLRARYASAGPGALVGISWRSVNPDHGDRKTAALENWDPILARPGSTFVNLQYGDVAAELASARARTGARILADPEIDQLVDMDGFAAQVAALDTVVTVGNAIAHTAGALGVAMHVLLGTPPLWMWLRGRDDSPWYPSARLHRQATPGDWTGPIASAAAALGEKRGQTPFFAAKNGV